ncbi:MAG: methyltransferase domain-containing protein [Eubacteriales bacterium]|nr:methyltransferase domain-containing protein [Eubacteriales bacterium]
MPIIKGLEWTFDTEAERYAALRPGYVQELYDDLFAYAPLNEAAAAVEVGIGGGQATLPVLKTGCRVTAVEYGAQFCRLCREKFAGYANFSIVNAKFEDYVSAGKCDLVYSASAFHWIPEEIGYPKVYAMLKRGGVFARFANHPYKDKGRQEIHEALQRLYAVYMPGSLEEGREYSEEDAQRRAQIAQRYGFEDIQY